jgi:hypothetical protein
MASKVVTFVKDVYPYCKGDVRRLEDSVLALVDKTAKGLKLGTVYVAGEKDVNEFEVDAEAGVNAAKEAIAKGLPSVRAAVTSADVEADHIEKTILGDGSVGTPAAADVAPVATTEPADQAAQDIPAVKNKKAVAKSNAATATVQTN